MGITKKRKAIAGKVDDKKVYSLAEASGLVKQVNTTKFDSRLTCTSVWVLILRKLIKPSGEQ